MTYSFSFPSVIILCLLLHPIIAQQKPCLFEENMGRQGLVEVQSVIKQVLVELKYASTDNFMHQNVYGCLTKAFLQKETVAKLAHAQSLLEKEKPSYRLLIYDAARPLSKQWDLWNALPQYPPNIRRNYVASPQEHSIHNYGSAVDLTIADEKGQAIDMGTPFDYFGKEAYPKAEKELAEKGILSKEVIQNRLLLRKVMQKAGFLPIEYEWWHFNAFSRAEAKKKFQVVQ
ncbi:M15 family metallopeptidase [Aquirufa ecclesiirivi]|uniref:M15 family metallopeptidase n=1 Tax=Aquirufa ecclesiirivi TaxID=2715124 RepID=UPI001F2412BC|nr:M15 family metallopeptidase [Aquirufa ecclesiirivi]